MAPTNVKHLCIKIFLKKMKKRTSSAHSVYSNTKSHDRFSIDRKLTDEELHTLKKEVSTDDHMIPLQKLVKR